MLLCFVNFQDDLYNNCLVVPTHVQGLIAVQPVTAGGAIYDDFNELWNNGSGATSDKVTMIQS